MSVHYRTKDLLYYRTPLYHQFPNRSEPEKAYIEMEQHGFVRAVRPSKVEIFTPMSVICKAVLRWPVSPYADGESLNEFLMSDRMRSLLERVHAGHSVEFNGSRFVGTLTQEAQDASREIESLLKEKPYLENMVYSFQDWFQSRFSVEDVFAAGGIQDYLRKVREEVRDFHEKNRRASLEGIDFDLGDAVENLCADCVEKAMKGDGSTEVAHRLARMLVDYDPETHEDLMERFDVFLSETLPFNRDGNFDEGKPTSLDAKPVDDEPF